MSDFSPARLVRYAMAHPIGERQRLRTLARIARWQLRARLVGGPRVHPWVGGSRLVVERGMTGATGNIYFGLHEFADMGFVLHMLRPGELFVDIGANIGSFTILAAKVAGADVLAFEPDTNTAATLERNIAANGVEAQVAVHRSALGDREQELWFTSGMDTINHVADADTPGAVRVHGTTLDTVLAGRVPALIKIDVEGHEPAVVAGAAKTLAAPELRAVEVETVTQDVADMLESRGFVRRHYDPFTRRLSQTPVHAANNSLYVRDESFLAQRLQSAPPVDVYGIAV
jgi:FkbM family methyltransferase